MNALAHQFDLIEAMGCQRWNQRRDLYRPAGEPIDTDRYGVDLVSESEARDFVAKHHYAGSLPPTRVRVGLFRSMPFRRAELVGVAVFSVPVQAKALECYFGVDNDSGVELGRLGGRQLSWALSDNYVERLTHAAGVRSAVGFLQ